MSTLTQFFGGGSGGGGGSYIEAKVLVVGGGASGFCSFGCKQQPPSCPNGSCNCLRISYGGAGGVIYRDGVLKPGTSCPIQVGAGASSTSTIQCAWCGPCACCFRVCFQDGGPGGASYFGGTGGLCAEGGIGYFNPSPTSPCPTAGSFSSATGTKNIGRSGQKNFDAFSTGFECSANTRQAQFSNNIVGPSGGGMYVQSSSIATCAGVTDVNFTPIPSAGAATLQPTGQFCPYQYYNHHGFYHELLGAGNGQIVGASKFGQSSCKSCFCIQCSYCCEVLCPTYTDAIKNFGGLGNGTGSGGEMCANIGGCPGSVIVQYPNTYDAVPAPNRPGSVDCSPNTPGFYTYYYLTPGSITLP